MRTGWLAAIVAWFAGLVAGASRLELEHARSAAAVAAARASMTTEPSPEPEPPRHEPCPRCRDTGWIPVDKGTRKRCDCGSGASPASAMPATP